MWNLENKCLNSWLERLEEHFVMADIMEERKKVSNLLIAIGESGYELIKALTSPDKPSTKSYEELKRLLINHLAPKPLKLIQRHKFARIKQTGTVTEFLTALRQAAEQCEFGSFYAESLRDRFICGLADEKTKKTLLASDKEMVLEETVKIALLREQADRESREMGDTQKKFSAASAYVTKEKKKSYRKSKLQKKYLSTEDKCKVCKLKRSSNKCLPEKCRTICFKCERSGHQKKFCTNYVSYSKSDINRVANDSECITCLDSVLTKPSISNSSDSSDNPKPVLGFLLNSHLVKMEVDTGSELTIISKEVVKNIPNIEFNTSNRIIKVANGEYICDINETWVTVKYQEQVRRLKLYCTEGKFPSLLGRDWIGEFFGKDWLGRLTNEVVNRRISLVNKSEEDISVTGNIFLKHNIEEDIDNFFNQVKKSNVFQEGLGQVCNAEVRLQVKPGAKPIFRKSRTLPYAVRDTVEKHLRKQIDEGIFIMVESSEYASPIVTTHKPDGSIRVCGDYKHTINPLLDVKQYPLPTEEECFYPLRAGEKFTKLDIRQAYNQISLGEKERKLLTLNTPLGLLQPTRLPFGISSATAIFQEIVDKVLEDIPMTVCRVDDICISGKTSEEHLNNVTKVLKRLEDAGFRCRLDKCEFYKDEVMYLGHRLNSRGIFPIAKKVETLKEACYPENLSQLVSFLGAVNYYGKFIRELSTICEPLNRLRKKGVKWKFGREERQAFDKLKECLSSDTVLMQYDPNLPIKIDTDASQYGLGAVISHMLPDGNERPIEYASRTLNKAERNYGQIEKEALSLVWSVKKFHRYIYARKFILVTDHKPLLFLLGENKPIPEMGVSRIIRWATILSSYQYQLQFRSTTKHCNADVCSRFPLKEMTMSGKDEVTEVFFSKFADKPVINHLTVSKYTNRDPVLSKVKTFIKHGWDRKLRKEREYLRSYFKVKNELSIEYDCILWNSRVVIPEELRKDVLRILHIAHQGIVAVKALARTYVWWPNINHDIEQLVKNCEACDLSLRKPNKAKPHPWSPTSKAWERLHIDFCGPINGRMYLIVVDAYTKWLEVFDMRTCTTSSSTIKELRKLFAQFGIPFSIVSDNGPQFVSREITDFFRSNGIIHVKVPTYSQSCNGLAERQVQAFKKAMEKAKRDNGDFDTALANWLLHNRNTPRASTNKSPAIMMLGRETRTLLTQVNPLSNRLLPKESDYVSDSRLRMFQIGDHVRVLNIRHDEWQYGIITGKLGCKVYLILTNGKIERIHLDHIREVNTDSLTNENHNPKSESNGRNKVCQENSKDVIDRNTELVTDKDPIETEEVTKTTDNKDSTDYGVITKTPDNNVSTDYKEITKNSDNKVSNLKGKKGKEKVIFNKENIRKGYRLRKPICKFDPLTYKGSSDYKNT